MIVTVLDHYLARCGSNQVNFNHFYRDKENLKRIKKIPGIQRFFRKTKYVLSKSKLNNVKRILITTIILTFFYTVIPYIFGRNGTKIDYANIETESQNKFWSYLGPNHQVKFENTSYYSYLRLSNQVYELGVGGLKSSLTNLEEILQYRESKANNSLNWMLSQRIALNRSLLDYRPKNCLSLLYDIDLPKASIIIVLNNEPLTVVLRLLWGIFERSPLGLLEKIILYDDASEIEELKKPLTDYITDTFPKPFVKIYRGLTKLGLLQSRILAASKSTEGTVLIFLDAKCEVTIGWLEPLLQRIKDNPLSLLSPIIDTIGDEGLEYVAHNKMFIGSFTWNLEYQESFLPEAIARRTQDNFITTPTIPGTIFAVNRKHFFNMGTFDSEMVLWNEEVNLELSFRYWQCGGSVEFIPCSHVGQIKHTVNPYGRPNGKEFLPIKNSLRVANMWMDNYLRLFYLFDPDSKNLEVPDVTYRTELRMAMMCKTFKWYLDNVIPEKIIPDENVKAYGNVKTSNELCLDMLGKDIKTLASLSIYKCQSFSPQEFFSLDQNDRLVIDSSCVYLNESIPKSVLVAPCSTTTDDKWQHSLKGNSPIKHVRTGLCLDIEGRTFGDNAYLSPCSNNKSTQLWTFQNYP